MSVTWVYGHSGSGKTTTARALQRQLDRCVHLDDDDMRRVWTDLGYGEADRHEQNMRVAHLARVLDRQGFNIVVSTICPQRSTRKAVQRITGCTFIHVEGNRDKKQW